MDEQSTPQARRTARLVGAGVLAGGLALAGGGAFAASRTGGPASRPAAATAVQPVVVQPGAAQPAVVQPVAELVAEPVAEPASGVVDDQTARTAFFAAGYDYDDAVELAATWKPGDPFDVKALAGRALLAGEALPIAPGSADPVPVEPVPGPIAEAESAALDAYFGAGYDYDDAVELGEVWNVGFFEAKVSAGEKLLAGEVLPVLP